MVEILCIIDSCGYKTVAVWKELVFFGWFGVVFFGGYQGIKRMVSSFTSCNRNYSGFLQQVTLDIRTLNCIVFTKIHLNVFSESTWIVVPDSFTVSKGFKNWITWENFFFNWVMLLFCGKASRIAERSQYFHTVFCGLCFTGATLSWDNDGLFGFRCFHL